MTRRIPLPGAAELFRVTSSPAQSQGAQGVDGFRDGIAAVDRSRESSARRGSPRQKHNSKITVYVSDEELLAMEHARLVLRAAHEVAVDRGRVVREAVAIVLADLEENGENSMLVKRLRQDGG